MMGTNSEPVVTKMVTSDQWIEKHGLYARKLTRDQMLQKIGFPAAKGYVGPLKKTVESRYSIDMFNIVKDKDGNNIHLTAKSQQLGMEEAKLNDLIGQMQRRLNWLKSSSREKFGVITERKVALIMESSVVNNVKFGTFCSAVASLVREQVIELDLFNVIISGIEVRPCFNELKALTKDTLRSALAFVLSQQPSYSAGSSSVVESIYTVSKYPELEAIYLLTQGNQTLDMADLLVRKTKKSSVPIHSCVFGECDSAYAALLREISANTGGRWHRYDNTSTSEDTVSLTKEMSQAKDVLAEIQALRIELDRKNVPKMPQMPPQTPEKLEKDMSSAEWLTIHGLKAVNTRFYGALKHQAFRHCDSVVKCGDKEKLVNAKYCENFAHVKWYDGSVKHVMINKTFFEDYKSKIEDAVNVLEKRIHWLENSSRQVFGSLIEDNVTIILDTSASMERHLPCLKKKLERLITEQLRHRIMFNLIMFGSTVDSLNDGVVRVTPVSLQAAWKWCSSLMCGGSTNTMGALRKALSDPLVHGIYLLSDGRPDFPEEKILNQVAMYKTVPIHTISFNCNDHDANNFLSRLAEQTGGRFHVVSSTINEGYSGPEPYESLDIKLLRLEREAAELDMKKMTELRAECALLEWRSMTKETPVKEEKVPSKRKNVKRPKSSESERSGGSEKKSAAFNAKRWLSKHGLMARRLTIMDALAPTLITQQPKYVGILKKKVHAKVFDDVMPFMYLSPEDRDRIRFVNPAAVDLVSYESKLQCAIAAYDKQISTVIWGKLDDAEKAKFTLQRDEKSPGFIENKELFESVLERLKWPVSRTSVQLMTSEIELGQLYLTQSEQLRDQLNTDRKKPKDSPPVCKTSVSSTPSKSGENYLLGYRVTAQNNIDGFYYPGLVIESHARQSCTVEFEDYDRQKIPVTNLIPTQGSISRPRITSGDYVLVQLILDKATGSKPIMFAPGLVTDAPERNDQPAFAVLLFTGEKLVASRNDLIKITKKRYTTTSSMIYKLLNRQRSSQRLRLVAEGAQDDTASIASTLDEILKSNRLFEDKPVQDKPNLTEMLETPRIPEVGNESEATLSDSEPDDAPDVPPKDVIADPPPSKQYSDVGVETVAMAKVTLECGLQVGGYDISAQTDISNDFWDDLNAVKGQDEVIHESEIFIDDVPMLITDRQLDLPVLKVSATTPIQTDDILSIPESAVQDLVKTIELDETNPNETEIQKSIREDMDVALLKKGDILLKGHTVLARWSEEGWYFRGKVVERSEGGYKVQDNNGLVEDILKRFVLTDEADGKHRLKSGDHVVALHPDYSYSYAPAKVDGTEDNWFYSLTFYEGTEADIPREEMYYINPEHYKEDVDHITSIESALLGNFVLARDDEDGLYRRAVVTKCTGRMYELNILQSFGSILQDPGHVFTDKRKGGTVAEAGSHILCPLDSTENTYGPCTIIKVNEDKTLHIKFHDGNEVYSVRKEVVFDVSSDYYINAVNFIKSRS